MHSRHVTPQRLRAFLARRPRVLWPVVFVVLLKAAVPLLALWSAHERGASLAEVCSVYGVRALADDQKPNSSRQSEHARSQDCALAPLLGAAFLAAPMRAAVGLHVPAFLHLTARAKSLSPKDASFAWLTSRTHAPPLSVRSTPNGPA